MVVSLIIKTKIMGNKIFFTEIVEKSNFYTLSKQDEQRFKDSWFGYSLPTIKKKMWGIEIQKPIGYIVCKAFIGDDGKWVQNQWGWIFEKDGGMNHVSTKYQAKQIEKV